MGRVRFAAALALALASGVALADQKLGVELYPGSELLQQRTAYLLRRMGVADGGCYRAPASVSTVTSFIVAQPGFQFRAGVLRRLDVDVVVRGTTPPAGTVGPYSVYCVMPARN